MIKWEYKTEAILVNKFDGKVQDFLDKFGADGWELVAAPLYCDALSFIFKRPIPEPNQQP